MQVKLLGTALCLLVGLAAANDPRNDAGQGRDVSTVKSRAVGDVTTTHQPYRRGCTVGVGAHVGDVAINFSLEFLTNTLLGLNVSVTHGLTQIANLTMSASPADLSTLAEAAANPMQTALTQLLSARRPTERRSADELSDKLESVLGELVSGTAGALKTVQGLAGSLVNDQSVGSLQKVVDLTAQLVGLGAATDPKLLQQGTIKADVQAAIASVQGIGHRLNATKLELAINPKGQALNAALFSIGFGLGLGPDIGVGGGVNVNPDGSFGGGFNAGVPGAGIGGGFNCGH
ncbi:hypothetical protein V8E36_003936 [Tilletia maclaganii]